MMKIAVDAMGGDHAPHEIVKGALAAARTYKLNIILVGDESKIKAVLTGGAETVRFVDIVHTPEVINMDEHPATAVRRKRDSSIVRTVRLVKEGDADAMVSAGNTGAVMASSLLYLGRLKGIDRPAIAGVIPTKRGATILIDMGANVDVKPDNLVQFALMGHIYAEKILGILRPRVGLLSIGEEDSKGNELTRAALPLLKSMDINFVGNVEGRDIFNGTLDVVVCDGFVGNVILKSAEGLVTSVLHIVREEVKKSAMARVGMFLSIPVFKRIQRRLDYAEYGGAPLLGVNGVTVVAHGSSNAWALKNAVRMARDSVEQGLVSAISGSIKGSPKKGVLEVDA